MLEGEGFAVVDDVLPPAAFASLSHEVGNGDYHSVHARRWEKAWRLWDGNPLRGAPVYYDPTGAHGWKGATYPTFTSVDILFESICQMAVAHPRIAGAEGVDWTAMFLSPWLYPVGSALSLHLDGGNYSGAFTYFAHTRWNLHWGGELLILPGTATAPSASGGGSPWISEDNSMEADVDLGIGTCVFPRPNRLVLLGPDRPHMIRRVDANAGMHVRASLAGFLLRP